MTVSVIAFAIIFIITIAILIAGFIAVRKHGDASQKQQARTLRKEIERYFVYHEMRSHAHLARGVTHTVVFTTRSVRVAARAVTNTLRNGKQRISDVISKRRGGTSKTRASFYLQHMKEKMEEKIEQ